MTKATSKMGYLNHILILYPPTLRISTYLAKCSWTNVTLQATPALAIWLNSFYTLKQLPPINSLANEFCAIPSVGRARK